MEIKSGNIKLLLALILAFALASCKKNNAIDNATKPVVVGYLMPGQPISIKVYEQKALTDTANYGPLVGGLQLTVSNGAKTVPLTETATGTYTYADQTFLAVGKTYTLQFTYNGTAVSATTLMPAKPTGYTATKTYIYIPLASTGTPNGTDSVAVTFKWRNPDSLYHVLVFKNDDNSPWNIHPYMNSPVNFTLNAKQTDTYSVYYRQFNYLGIYRAILYSVNKEYIDALVSNANTSSQKLVDPPSNIVNGYGIFTAMQADTIKVEIDQ